MTPRSRPKTKTAKRLAAQRAAAEAAAARKAAAQRRRRRLTVLSVALAVLLVAGAASLTVWLVRDSGGDNASRAGSDNPSASPSSTAFPPLPPGADAALRTKPTVTAGSGNLAKLTTKSLVEGTGPAIKAGQTVSVNYVGVSYQTGQEFDSSWSRSQPFSFQLGGGNVIKGWDQGLVGAKVGSRVQLDIPAELAYGNDASGGAPTGPLRFVVDVLSAS